ncbi:MAG TPA: hypothetical protein VK338_02905 [Candidatus Nitrosocosmicus sp.]|nr:hypothetical protein [Candidatus Nitrosocosmicus sp.]
MLSPESVLKYQAIYKKVYGKELDFKTAEEQGMRLLNLVRVVFEDKNAVNHYLFHKQKGVKKYGKT